jgi:hypothetical protein
MNRPDFIELVAAFKGGLSKGVDSSPLSLGILMGSEIESVATPLWPSVGVKPNTPKVGDLESSGTPECLGFDSKAQNTSH